MGCSGRANYGPLSHTRIQPSHIYLSAVSLIWASIASSDGLTCGYRVAGLRCRAAVTVAAITVARLAAAASPRSRLGTVASNALDREFKAGIPGASTGAAARLLSRHHVPRLGLWLPLCRAAVTVASATVARLAAAASPRSRLGTVALNPSDRAFTVMVPH